MNDKYLTSTSKLTLLVGVIASLVVGLIRINLGIGLFLGLVVGYFNLRITTNYVDNLFFKAEFTVFSFLLYVFTNYGLMILVFLLSVLYPNWVNIYMVALGLVMLKLVVYVKEVGFYKKGGSK